MPQQTIGWQDALPEIVGAAAAARHAAPFDEKARAREVARRVADAKKFPWWPAVVALFAFVFPNGWVFATAALLLFGGLIYRAMQRGAELEASLHQETLRLRAAQQIEMERIAATVAAANIGNREALQSLLSRWHTLRPESVRRFVVDLAVHQFTQGSDGHTRAVWQLSGNAIRREDITAGVPRIGRGGRTVYDKRKASEIDEDLAELNAGAVLAVLLALFSGPTAQPVIVRIDIPNPSTGALVPWVTLSGMIGREALEQVCRPITSAVDSIRRLGGDVGRWRNQRLTAAKEPAVPPRDASQLQARADARPAPAPTRASSMPTAHVSLSTSAPPAARDAYGARAAGITFGETPPAPQPVAGGGIPTAPAFFGTSIGLSSGTPSPSNVKGQFSTVARKFATYAGDPAARFVAFKAYYSTYAQMAPGQLKFYFKWRHAVRNGETPRTDLSYIFVHVYELLHLIGAENATHAALQLERLWTSYRVTYPNLDHYLVQWITDLYATEIGNAMAFDFVERAATLGAAAGQDEILLVADKQWIGGTYAEMSNASLGLLVGDPRLGENKFYLEHNTGDKGNGWVDQAYRQALTVTDRFFQSQHGRTPREQTILTGGYRSITRSAFQNAVYDWKRKTVTLGKVPDLTNAPLVAQTYRNAVRYTENLLRKERNFAAKLRGIEIEPGLAQALDAHFASYIRTTRPKARVTIDLTKAQELARESADVRARLLEGLEPPAQVSPTPVPPPATSTSAYPAVSPTAQVPSEDAPAEHLAAGLLTDLAAIRDVLSSLTAPARALIEALAAQGWESPEHAPELNAAAAGVLIRPLIDEINERAVAAIGDVLVVSEGATLVLQEDFRDEVHWVLNGSCGRSVAPVSCGAPVAESAAQLSSAVEAQLDTDGFGPVELRALAIIAAGGAGVTAALLQEAAELATTPLLLVDRINEGALASSYGDILVDAGASPPVLLEDAREYVEALLERVRPLLDVQLPSDAHEAESVPS